MKRKFLTLGLALALASLVTGVVWAAAGAGYDLSWWTVDGGGGSSSGGAYTLGGTAGQPDTGRSTGGVYTLVGGFWAGGAVEQTERLLYLPLITR